MKIFRNKICILFLSLVTSNFVNFSAFSESLPKVCMVLDKGGKDDHSFNESAVLGFKKALSENLMLKESVFVEPKSDNQISQFFRSFSTSSQCDLIIAIGFNPASYLINIAAQFPAKKYLAVDVNLESKNSSKNIRSITFQEHEGSFLVGAIAAMKSSTGKIGFIGGMDIPLIHRFQMGYEAGAKYINPNVKVFNSYVGLTADAWNNPAKAKELALSQYNNGADIIFQVAANSGLGVFDSAEQMNLSGKGKKYFAIGVDANQNWLKPDVILTSMVKKVDVAVYLTIKDFKQSKFTSGHVIFDFMNSGIDWSLDKFNRKFFTSSDEKEINKIKEKIMSKKINVPDYYKL